MINVEDITTDNIRAMLPQIQEWLGIPPGSEVMVFCLTCREVFVNEDWVTHNDRFLRSKAGNVWEFWKVTSLEHWLDNPEHEILYIGWKGPGTLMNFTTYYRDVKKGMNRLQSLRYTVGVMKQRMIY